jgi:hypothetical protein
VRVHSRSGDRIDDRGYSNAVHDVCLSS